MTSPAQYAANRLNAEKSTGPSTPKGKVRSSLNALLHGLTARVVVLPSEDLSAYQAFSKEIVDSLEARTSVERQLAQRAAVPRVDLVAPRDDAIEVLTRPRELPVVETQVAELFVVADRRVVDDQPLELEFQAGLSGLLFVVVGCGNKGGSAEAGSSAARAPPTAWRKGRAARTGRPRPRTRRSRDCSASTSSRPRW